MNVLYILDTVCVISSERITEENVDHKEEKAETSETVDSSESEEEENIVEDVERRVVQ